MSCLAGTMAVALALAGTSFVTKIALLVITGSLTTLLSCVGLWAVARLVRAGLSGLRSRLSPRVLDRWVNFRTRRVPVVSHGNALTPASLVRLVGVVDGDGTTRAAFSGLSAVAARHEIGERGGGRVNHGMAAQNFTIRLQDGHKVTVQARDALDQKNLRLIDRDPDRWRDGRNTHGWFCESRLAPGDEVEVIGQAARTIDRNSERIGDRQPALSWTVVAGSMPLSLRFGTRRARTT